jgi:hypothetical protein
MEKELLKGVTQLALMNTKMLAQLYGLHHDFVEKVLPLIPGDTTLLFHISKTEQLSAHLSQLSDAVEKMLKACDGPPV